MRKGSKMFSKAFTSSLACCHGADPAEGKKVDFSDSFRRGGGLSGNFLMIYYFFVTRCYSCGKYR